MTTFAAAEEALLNEVENRIQTLVPNKESGTRFTPISDKVIELGGGEQLSGRARAFHFGPAVWVERTQCGASYTMATYTHDITIYYPAGGRRWNNIAMSDAAQIERDLLNNGNNTSGCQNRLLDSEAPFSLEHDEDDDYQTLTLTLRVMYETTAT